MCILDESRPQVAHVERGGTFAQRPTFIEVYLENNQLFYRPVGEEKTEGVLLYSN